MPQLQRPGVLLNYELWRPVQESGNWVTLINGHNRPLNDFRMLGRFLNQRGHPVMAFDNRGAGKTRTDGDFTLRDMADDVSALWSEVGIDVSHVLGISMGGCIAQSLSGLWPDAVLSLTLVSTAARAADIRQDDRPWSGEVDAVLAKLKPYFTPEFAERNSVLIRSMAKQVAKAVVEEDFLINSRRQRQAMSGFDHVGTLGKITAPVLIVHGDADGIIPVAATQVVVASLARPPKMAIIKNCGHLLLAECPRELYAAAGEFIDAHDVKIVSGVDGARN